MAGTLLIRADAGEGIGTGHVMRSLALARAWQAAGGRATLLGHCPAPALVERIRAAGVAFEPLDARHPGPGDLPATLDSLKRMRSTCVACRSPHDKRPGDERPVLWALLDGYHFDADYQRTVRETGCRLAVIDDLKHLPHYHADLLVNQNLGAEQSPYVCDERTALLLGPRYVLLRPEFGEHERASRAVPETARHVLVTLGGEDANNATLRVVRALGQVDVPGLEARILVGPANPYLETLCAEVEQSPANLELVSNAADVPGLMAWADLAVTAAGCTCWELAFMQVPAVAVILAENQRRVAEPLAAAGAVTNLGWIERLTEDGLAEAIASFCLDRGRRMGQVEAGRRIVDGHGAERVVAIMRALDGPIVQGDLTLRPVTRDDVLPVWRLANAPSVRLHSLASEPIPLDTHVRWFRERLASPRTRMWALDLAGLVAGLIRYDRAGEDTASVHFSVAPPFRGRGLGTQLLDRTRKPAGEELGVKRLEAVVRQENTASARVFIKSGFAKVRSEPVQGRACHVFEQQLDV